MIHYILTDIEGTTSSINFVHRVLFPYAKQHLRAYVKRHASEEAVKQCLEATRQTVAAEEGRSIDRAAAIEMLLHWIDTDRKHPALKQLQGYIWRSGYESGAYKGHVYADVPPCLEQWTSAGLKLGVYSSGSVEAQQLLFKYSDHGDLTPYFTHYFDTAVGAKKEMTSYRNIEKTLGIAAVEILFLSDVEAELDAAAQAGFQTTQLLREGTVASPQHSHARDFYEVKWRD